MKVPIPVICLALLFTSCAHMHVTHTEVATGAVNPSAIYIRPFNVTYASYVADPHTHGALIRKSLAPAAFANDLQEELAKLAPAMIIEQNQIPTQGWLVEGEFVEINAGSGDERYGMEGFHGTGRSHLKLHVRITDLDRKGVVGAADYKDGARTDRGIATPNGLVIYEFDVAGGSGRSGCFGSILAPGLGDAIPFDFRNAAEQIMITLSPDPFRYGYRSSPSQNL